MGGDMPQRTQVGEFQCASPSHPGGAGRIDSFTNTWEILLGQRMYSKKAEINARLLNCQPVELQEIYDTCSHGKPGSVFNAPNLKPVSMLSFDDKILAVVQCTYEGPCITASEDPLACDDPTYPACQRGINSWIISSTDGVTWKRETPHDFFTGRTVNPMFIQAGRAYDKAPDEYAYIHFPVSYANGTERSCWYGNDFLLLGRVKRTLAAVTNRSAYEFWMGEGQAWSADDTAATHIFDYHHMIGAPHSFYNPPLKRYIIPNFGSLNTHTKMPWSETAGVGSAGLPDCRGAGCPFHSTQLVLYEGENPWGPWRQMFQLAEWEWGGQGPQGVGHQEYSSGAYSPDFPAQWISDDGLDMWMVSSACCNFTTYDPRGFIPPQNNYQFHVTPVHLSLKAGDDAAAGLSDES